MCVSGISRHPRGAALVIVMLVMAVLLMAGTAFLTISSTESQIALNEQGYAMAYALAEAGIHKAVTLINAGPTYAGETNTALGGGTFTVTVVTPSTRIQDRCPIDNSKDIIATASVPVRGGNAVVTLKVTVDQVIYPYSWAAFAAVPDGVVGTLWDPMNNSWWDRSSSEVLLRDSNFVDSFDSGIGPYNLTTNSAWQGSIGANGDVELDYNSTIDGNVQAGDGLYLGVGVTVTGTQASGLSPTSTPGLPFPSVTAASIPQTTSSSSGVSPASDIPSPGVLNVPAGGTVTLSKGTYNFTSISMGDNSKLVTTGGPVTIYVTGPPIAYPNEVVVLGYNVTMGASPGTQLQIVTKSDGSPTDPANFHTWVTMDGFRLYGSLYGKQTDIYVGYNSQVYGSVIGRTFRARKGSSTHFDQAMINQKRCHNDSTFYPRYTIRRGTWQESIPRT